MAYGNLGNILACRGQVDEAVALYQQAIKVKPDHGGAYVNLGVILSNRGQVDEAITYYQKALELTPNSPAHTIISGPFWPAAASSTRPSPISARPLSATPTTRRPTITSARR